MKAKEAKERANWAKKARVKSGVMIFDTIISCDRFGFLQVYMMSFWDPFVNLAI